MNNVVKLVLESLSPEERGFYKGKRVLVVGGAGFIGSWLSEALHALEASVTCLDNMSTGSYRNLENLLGKERFELIEADITRAEIGKGYDVAFHGAAMPAPDMYMERPIEAMLPDSLGLLRVLESVEGRVVFMSSSEVYGDAEVIPTPESYHGKVDPLGPRSPYEESKRFGEALAMAFYRQRGKDVRIARIFNTYGPRLDPGSPYARVVTRFIERALAGKPLEVHGDGLQTRSFTFVSDTVGALLKLGACDNCAGEAFNIGSEEEVTILELAALVLELTGSSSPIVHVPPRQGDPRRRRPDTSKARERLGWKPRVSLGEGLMMTIEWYRGRGRG
ncbi:MAG: GDP-mannose 4,6-dehydratase [Acidilobaceae archaeon]|nr:GDP-mannose 4,6-dehydratase [Acidilobaceae archaeon]